MKKLPLDRNCFVTSVTLVFLRRFGADALEWDPLIVKEAFESVFDIRKMPQRMFDKLNCGLTLIGTSAFTDSIEGFLTGTANMNNLVFDGATAPFVTFEQCAWGVWEYINLNGDIDKQSRPTETFCPDVIKYIQDVGRLNGIVKMPVWLDFANLPDNAMPDLTGDVHLFETYMARQQDYISDMNGYVTHRQKELTEELKKLSDAGLVG